MYVSPLSLQTGFLVPSLFPSFFSALPAMVTPFKPEPVHSLVPSVYRYILLIPFLLCKERIVNRQTVSKTHCTLAWLSQTSLFNITWLFPGKKKSNFPDQISKTCEIYSQVLASTYTRPSQSFIDTDKFSTNFPSSLQKQNMRCKSHGK